MYHEGRKNDLTFIVTYEDLMAICSLVQSLNPPKRLWISVLLFVAIVISVAVYIIQPHKLDGNSGRLHYMLCFMALHFALFHTTDPNLKICRKFA